MAKKHDPANPQYTSAQLAAALGVHAKTVLLWVREGLLPSVRFEGPATRYGAVHLRLGRAIARAGVEVARHPRFAEMIPIFLDEPVVAPRPVPGPEAPIDGAAWSRVELVPGIELHVKADMPPALRVLAREVAGRFGKAL